MSESNVKIEKIQKSSNVALILVRITKIFCIVMSVIAIVCGCLMIGMKSYLDQEFDKAIETGAFTEEDLRIQFDGGFLEGILELEKVESIALTVGVYVIVAGIMLICFAVVMHFVGKVFQNIKESYSPFRPEIVKNLKVAFVLITVLVLQNSLLIGAVVGFSLWCVLQIFEYGCELQRQSDETL